MRGLLYTSLRWLFHQDLCVVDTTSFGWWANHWRNTLLKMVLPESSWQPKWKRRLNLFSMLFLALVSIRGMLPLLTFDQSSRYPHFHPNSSLLFSCTSLWRKTSLSSHWSHGLSSFGKGAWKLSLTSKPSPFFCVGSSSQGWTIAVRLCETLTGVWPWDETENRSYGDW